jgi:hypothetical protein
VKKSGGKPEIMSFKVEPWLAEALRRIPNRSEFIRRALATALDGVCPLCGGSGLLDPDERRHWLQFAESHAVRQCQDCRSYHLVCLGSDATRCEPTDEQRP